MVDATLARRAVVGDLAHVPVGRLRRREQSGDALVVRLALDPGLLDQAQRPGSARRPRRGRPDARAGGRRARARGSGNDRAPKSLSALAITSSSPVRDSVQVRFASRARRPPRPSPRRRSRSAPGRPGARRGRDRQALRRARQAPDPTRSSPPRCSAAPSPTARPSASRISSAVARRSEPRWPAGRVLQDRARELLERRPPSRRACRPSAPPAGSPLQSSRSSAERAIDRRP